MAAANLLERIAVALGDDYTVLPPHKPGGPGDVLVVPRRGDTDPEQAARALAEAGLGTSARAGDDIWVTVPDEQMRELGWLLEAGRAAAMDTGDIAAGQGWVFCYCDPNATKALHVGHLRNIAIGHGLASLLRAAGAQAVEQQHVCDIGYAMGEALAGYLSFAREETPQSAAMKSDHFVGTQLRRYVSTLALAEAGEGSADPALSREDRAGEDDLASQLNSRLAAGDPELRERWLRLREWVLDGQRRTFADLQIEFDRTYLESDFVAEIDRLGELLLSEGVAERAESGAVLYESGRPDEPHLLLNRSDGHPTQHLRYLGLWWATRPDLRGTHSVQVAGDEWQLLTSSAEEILRRVETDEVHPTQAVLHAMVTMRGKLVKSSQGEPMLIDELLDRLAAAPEVERVAALHEDAEPRRLAAVAALGRMLASPRGKRVDVDFDDFLGDKVGTGWAIAQAWVKAWSPRCDGDPDPDPGDVEYRYLVVQSQAHRILVRRAIEQLDFEMLMRFHTHLARWYLQASDDPRLARAMRAILAAAVSSLGLPEPVPGEMHQTGLEPVPSA